MNASFLARIANQLPADCIWLFSDDVVLEACRLLELETLAALAEIKALNAEIAADTACIAALTDCLASLKAELS